jgi:hypothetical protein
MRGGAARSLQVLDSKGPDALVGPLDTWGFIERLARPPAQVPAAVASRGWNSGAFSP